MSEAPDIYVLDTSAWLTLIEDEAGADCIEALLDENSGSDCNKHPVDVLHVLSGSGYLLRLCPPYC